MASTQSLQALLRFLSQDAKLPLAQAMSKIKDLQAGAFNTPSDIAQGSFEKLKVVFGDDKTARQVLNAAKRQSKKRKSTDEGTAPLPSPKKSKPLFGQPLNPSEFERSLALPDVECDETVLKATTVFTNRAPLLLAFAVTLLKYTMPDQPISSRLSLAQAVVSMNSKNKAIHIGIDKGQAAEDEGWGEGQPIVRIMTRDVRVMKRWGYEWEAEDESTQGTLPASTPETLGSSQATLVAEPIPMREPALWAIDLEALKKKSNDATAPSYNSSMTQLPIYAAQSARAYLLKAIDSPKDDTKPTTGKRTAANIAAEKETNAGRLIGALELLFDSWAQVLSKEDLDKRTWGWYVRVRPEVAHGPSGWGGKGNVKLSDILDLRRTPEPV